MTGNGNSTPDPEAGLCIFKIVFDPLSSKFQFNCKNIPNHVIALGMLDLAREEYLKQAVRKQPQPSSILTPAFGGRV